MKLERLVCIGVSHQTAPVALREQLSQWPTHDLRTEAIEELVILSTCNRLEVYVYLAEDASLTAPFYQPLLTLMATTQGVPAAEIEAHLYHCHGAAVANHLCRVAAGLESLIMGEGQILGQVSSALQQAYGLKSVGPVLGLLFRTAIKAGKRARTETRINANPVSVSSAAIALATQRTGDLRYQQIAVVGLGEIGQLALKGLQGRGVADLSLVNRTRTRAEELVTIYGGQPYAMDELPTILPTVDIVITATSAHEPILRYAEVVAAIDQRGGCPLTLIDLAVPRNIDPAVAALPTVTLYDVDDLRAVVDDALAARQAEVPKVETMIDELLAGWLGELHELRLRPVVVGLRQQAEQVRRQAVARSLRCLARAQGEISAETATQMDLLSRSLVNQLLHTPTLKVKEKAGQPDGVAYAALVCELFGLDLPLPEIDEASDLTLPTDVAHEEDADGHLVWLTAQVEVDDLPLDEYDPRTAAGTVAGAEGCTAHAAGLYCFPGDADPLPRYELLGQP